MRLILALLLALLSACGPQGNQSPKVDNLNVSVSRGTAPLAVTWNWQVSDPNADTLQCRLDANGDGAWDLIGCTPSSFSFTYSLAGNFTAKFRVEDGKGGFEEKTRAIEVLINPNANPNPNPNPSPNQNPRIASFTPTVAAGSLNVSFSWQIVDPENENLTCAVAVGSETLTVSDCTSGSTRSYTFPTPGQKTVSLKVTDPRGGSAEQNASFTLTSVTPSTNRNPVIAAVTATPNSGASPVNATLGWQISDPDGDTLRCQIDANNDGSFEYSFNSCTSAQTQAHSFSTLGDNPVRLVVSDGRGGSAERTLTVSVSSPAATNRNPVITQFSATPNSGTAPLNSTLGWQISDPDGDALTCGVDVNNDGTAEYTLNSCTSSSTQPHSFAAGSYTVRLTLSDGRGGTATQTVVVSASTPVPSGPDISISRVEWGQTILKENLKLVSGKQALLRVFVTADRSGVSGALSAQVWRGGALQGSVSLTGPATLPTSVIQGDLSQTFRGIVPADWVGSGLEVRLQADPSNAVAESNETNNSRTLTPNIMTVGTVLYLTSVPIRYTDTGASNTVRTASIPSFASFLADIFPIRGVQTSTRATAYSFSGNLRNSSEWSRLLSELRTLHSTDGRGPDHYYYGFVQTGYSSGIIGIGYINWPVAAGWDRSASSNYSDDSSAWVMAHELGHNFARLHAPCGATSGLDGSYPYSNARLGTWGYSFGNSALSLLNPNTVFDVMSYCNTQWTSDYTYEAVQRYLEANPPTANRVLAAQTNTTVLLVRGQIRESQVSLEPLMRIQAPARTPETGPYRLRLQTSSGFREVSFSTSVVASPHGIGVAPGSDSEEHFSFTVPLEGEVNSLEIARGGSPIFSRELGLRPMSADDPGLRFGELGGLVQLYWSPSVFPYASVAHLGQERTTLTLNLTGGEGRLETAGLPAGGQFEVVLSDGLNSRRWVFNR
jgi:hypothetical protein